MTCKDCIYAKWQLDKAGRIMNKAGECLKPYSLADAPRAVQVVVGFRVNPPRAAIWPDGNFDDCPQYEPPKQQRSNP